MNWRRSGKHNLLTGLYARFIVAFLLLGLLTTLTSYLRSQSISQDYAQKELATLQLHSQANLDNLVQHWEKEAQQTLSELDVLRIDQLSLVGKQTKLATFFTAQGENRAFDAMSITDKAGKLLYSNGCTALNQAIIFTQDRFVISSCDNEARSLYYIIALPIWLSEQDIGYAHLAKQITPSVLASIADGDSSAIIRYHGENITTSSSTLSVQEAEQLRKEQNQSSNSIQTDLIWSDTPMVAIQLHQILPEVEAWWSKLLPPILVVLIALGIIWFILGRWMQQLSLRINLLWSGVQSYSITQNRDDALPYLKRFLDREHTDDISRLGRTIIRMMHDVDKAREQEVIFSETLALLEEAVITIDADGNLIETSTGWHRLVRSATTTDDLFLDYIHPDDQEAWLAKSAQLLEAAKKIIHIRFRLNSSTVEHPWLEGRFLTHQDKEGKLSIRGAIRDVTQSYLQEKQITHMALHDALTGLANRILLEDRLQQSLLLCNRSNKQLAILFFDLDHFKQINDALGHKVGDKLLIALSKRISGCIRASDTLARWGGDEFVMLLTNISDIEEVRQITQKLLESMQDPITIEENSLPVSFSIGAALYPSDASDMQSLLSDADRAMFHAKGQGRNQAVFFADMNDKENGKHALYIQNRLASAIKAQRISVHYQPIINARTGQVHAVEALARWKDEDNGWISPASFISIAENLGLIGQLGDQMMTQAFATLAQWRADGLNTIMSVNVSSRQLFAPSFVPRLMLALEAQQLTPSDILLEVTESLALRDVDHAIACLQELQQLGFLIAIDDFGTGHSSLAQLQEINANKLKIDRAFVMRIEAEKGHNMVKAVTNMAQALHLRTVAEGVETEAQKNLLCEMGIDYLQGYYFSKPMPADDCLAWIKEVTGRLEKS